MCHVIPIKQHGLVRDLRIVAVITHGDPYPFVLLNLLFSVQAAYTGPVLLLSSNRAAPRDRTMAEHDYANN